MHIEIEGKGVSEATKQKVSQHLQKALQEQLASEAKTLGHDPGKAAIHGMTGVGTKSRVNE
jgi:hypothetical protein